jgi:hypothetical protein
MTTAILCFLFTFIALQASGLKSGPRYWTLVAALTGLQVIAAVHAGLHA